MAKIEYIVMDERALTDPNSATVLEAGEEGHMTQEKIIEEVREAWAPCAISFADKDGSFTFFQHIK